VLRLFTAGASRAGKPGRVALSCHSGKMACQATRRAGMVVAEVITVTERFTQAFWDERYSQHSSLWSGNPNRYLVSEVADLDPGAALDLGCGEGADAIWLAGRGWQVTAADISTVAIARGAAHAAKAGDGIAARIGWQHVDLLRWHPGEARYDLISAQYLHLPAEFRDPLFRHAAAAVNPGGTLLVVGHHPSDMQTTMPRPQWPELFFTGDDIAALLTPGEWDVLVNEARPHETTDPEGRPVTVHDTVLRARRHHAP
jgi:SAM-dependent methyltransferase